MRVERKEGESGEEGTKVMYLGLRIEYFPFFCGTPLTPEVCSLSSGGFTRWRPMI